jgi:1-hydroxycarotenoid 3,4-desaturase
LTVPAERVVVVGAGVGGLTAATMLAVQGLEVLLIERTTAPGGKMRTIEIAGLRLDAGPTVFTMRAVFDEIFAAAGTTLGGHVTLRPIDVLARHAWDARGHLDLYADIEHSADAIAAFAGPAEARGYREFCARAQKIFETLEGPFIRAARPANPLALGLAVGRRRLGALRRIDPFVTLWRALGEHFRDPRLRQLFGRYATYMGSSPFQAPATLMLIAHVERTGVWLVEGGMHRLALALAELAERHGATLRYGTAARTVLTRDGAVSGVELDTGERVAANAVVLNADVAAVAEGLFGGVIAGAVPTTSPARRSLSALTWSIVARTEGFPLLRHNVFFSSDYAQEFDDLFAGCRLPRAPTVYVCAQDRDDRAGLATEGPERLFCLVNAPATGDRCAFAPSEIEPCEEQTFRLLQRCGLSIRHRPVTTVVTTPADFERLYPATGGALYGRASHGWMASFQRPGARSRILGLYLAGGSTHPGAGVPMAALSGRLAAQSLIEDLASTRRSSRVAMRGGTSMR